MKDMVGPGQIQTLSPRLEGKDEERRGLRGLLKTVPPAGRAWVW
jgi:hypothetical protein